jgi:hypothetical protein
MGSRRCAAANRCAAAAQVSALDGVVTRGRSAERCRSGSRGREHGGSEGGRPAAAPGGAPAPAGSILDSRPHGNGAALLLRKPQQAQQPGPANGHNGHQPPFRPGGGSGPTRAAPEPVHPAAVAARSDAREARRRTGPQDPRGRPAADEAAAAPAPTAPMPGPEPAGGSAPDSAALAVAKQLEELTVRAASGPAGEAAPSPRHVACGSGSPPSIQTLLPAERRTPLSAPSFVRHRLNNPAHPLNVLVRDLARCGCALPRRPRPRRSATRWCRALRG